MPPSGGGIFAIEVVCLAGLSKKWSCQSESLFPTGQANNANQAELESKVFIGTAWAREGIRATKCYC